MNKLILIKIALTILCLIFIVFVKSQSLSGTVYEMDKNKNRVPLPGVNIHWAGTQIGTVTNEQGKFNIAKSASVNSKLVISFIGYKTDTINISSEQDNVEVTLKFNNTLKEIIIIDKQISTYKSRIEPLNIQNITGNEFKKAACCNLSESFETNASVDVSYSDAVTGAKQIQLLGLAGIYSQLMTENIPNIRGLATTYGMEYIPGSWMESIHISKGASSVINGYESITGQINTEYKKPDKSEIFYFNILTNNLGKTEGNSNASIKFNDRLSTMFLIHGEKNGKKNDFNYDLFLDNPLIEQYSFMNRWKYEIPDKICSQFGIKILDEDRMGGQGMFDYSGSHYDTTNGYGINIDTKHYEAFLKTGYIFKKPETSIAIISTVSAHEQNSFFGLNDYKGEQKNAYANLIYESIFSNTNHKYSTGICYMYNNFHEKFNDSIFDREEIIPGLFFQYTYHGIKNLTVLGGMRADFHNIHGTFYTPRLHLKYDINKKFLLRGSIGKGYRIANIFAENSFLMASSRKLIVTEKLKQEEAWNYGINFTKYFDIIGRELTMNIDLYRTDFINQVIVDMDESTSMIKFYNLKGQSYSNSFQIEINYELIERLDMTAAYRINDVKTTINDELVLKPLVSRYKSLLNLSYATNLKKWQFDFTAQFNGQCRLPDTKDNPAEYRIGEKSPAYTILNTQITKYFKKWNIYTGCENITDFIQKNPIIAPDNPFGNYFDASIVWGPIIGRKYYIGIRYAIDRLKK